VPGSSNPAEDVGDPFTRFFMLSSGYALGGSSCATTGWAIHEALSSQGIGNGVWRRRPLMMARRLIAFDGGDGRLGRGGEVNVRSRLDELRLAGTLEEGESRATLPGLRPT